MKKQLLKSAAVLTLAATVATTCQPVGAISYIRDNNKYPKVSFFENNDLIDSNYYKVAFEALDDKLFDINHWINSEEFKEKEFKNAIETLIVSTVQYEQYLNSLSKLSISNKDTEKPEYSHIDKLFIKKGINNLGIKNFNLIYESLKNNISNFNKEVKEIYKQHSDLYPFYYYVGSDVKFNEVRKEYYNIYINQLNVIYNKLKIIDKIIFDYSNSKKTKDAVEILSFISKEITYQEKKSPYKNWYSYIPNIRTANRKIQELDDAIDDFYSSVYIDRPKEYPRSMSFQNNEMKQIDNIKVDYILNPERKQVSREVDDFSKIYRVNGYTLLEDTDTSTGNIAKDVSNLLKEVEELKKEYHTYASNKN